MSHGAHRHLSEVKWGYCVHETVTFEVFMDRFRDFHGHIVSPILIRGWSSLVEWAIRRNRKLRTILIFQIPNRIRKPNPRLQLCWNGWFRTEHPHYYLSCLRFRRIFLSPVFPLRRASSLNLRLQEHPLLLHPVLHNISFYFGILYNRRRPKLLLNLPHLAFSLSSPAIKSSPALLPVIIDPAFAFRPGLLFWIVLMLWRLVVCQHLIQLFFESPPILAEKRWFLRIGPVLLFLLVYLSWAD